MNQHITYLSSFWTLASGLAGAMATGAATVSVEARGTRPPPPPRSGFAIRPAKLSGEETAPFCAARNSDLRIEENQARRIDSTSCLIQSILDSLKLGFKLLVLQGKPTVGILQQRFEILYPFISCK